MAIIVPMPKRSSKKQPDEQTQKLGAEPAPEAVKAPPKGKNPAAVELGRLGGKKGGGNRQAKRTQIGKQNGPTGVQGFTCWDRSRWAS
jgi:hypothetical protein